MKIEYLPPTGGTTEQEIRNGFLLFFCQVANHHPIQSTTGRRNPLCHVPTMI